jgi:hypothetical protein
MSAFSGETAENHKTVSQDCQSQGSALNLEPLKYEGHLTTTFGLTDLDWYL